jgi:hypothetical protein
MSLRIGIDYTAAVRQRAGIGRYTRGLVQALARLDRDKRYTLFMPHDSDLYQRYRLSGHEKILLVGKLTDDVALFEKLLTRKGVTVIVAPLSQALAVLRQQMRPGRWSPIAGHPTTPDTQGRPLHGRPVGKPGLSPRATAFRHGYSSDFAGPGP